MANDGQLVATNGYYSPPVTAVTDTLEGAWLSQEQRLQPDEGAVTGGPYPVTELQRLQGVRDPVAGGEPTLDEALRDPELFERCVKPYATLVEDDLDAASLCAVDLDDARDERLTRRNVTPAEPA